MLIAFAAMAAPAAYAVAPGVKSILGKLFFLSNWRPGRTDAADL